MTSRSNNNISDIGQVQTTERSHFVHRCMGTVTMTAQEQLELEQHVVEDQGSQLGLRVQ